MKRFAVPTIVATMLSLSLAVPVLAAAPSNDAYSVRTLIGSIPFSETLDTTQATADADDTEIHGQCGAPAIDVAVNSTATFTRTGSAMVGGTVVCDAGADFAFVDVQLRQRAGRLLIDGSGSSEVVCDGTVHPWTVEVFGNGLYKGGSATANVSAVACNSFGCGQDFEQRSVKLRRG